MINMLHTLRAVASLGRVMRGGMSQAHRQVSSTSTGALGPGSGVVGGGAESGDGREGMRMLGNQSLCRVSLIGHTGGAAELRTFDDGWQSLSVNVATNYVVGRGEERRMATQWLMVYVWESSSAFKIMQEVPTGSLVYVEGSLRIVERTGIGAVEAGRNFVNVRVDREGVVRVLKWAPRTKWSPSSSWPSSLEEE